MHWEYSGISIRVKSVEIDNNIVTKKNKKRSNSRNKYKLLSSLIQYNMKLDLKFLIF